MQADEVEYTFTGGWRYPTDSGYQSLPALDLNFGIEYELRLQYIPKYQFQTNHYYDIKLEFAHSYGTFNFDRTQYQASNGYTVPVGEPTITSYNPDMYNTTVIIKGANPDNAQRILNRIRFYFMVTPQDNGSTTSGSIHVGLTHLYIDDTTANNTIIDINDTVKDTNEKTGGILQELRNLPNTILHLFVPTSEELNSKIDSFKTNINGKLGIVGQFADLMDYFTNGVETARSNPNHVLDFGTAQFSVGDKNIVLWRNATLDLYPFSNTRILNYIKFFLWYIIVWGVIGYVRRLYMRITVGETVVEESD